MLRSAVWFLTFNCTNWCPYCWQRQRQKRGEFTPEPFKDYKLWVEAWNRLKPGVLDITGGEPFMQPNFVDMVSELEDVRVAITTNLRHDITDFVQRIRPSRVVSITASYHPSSDMSKDLFLGKCLLLKNRGFGVTVNFVTYPEQMFLAPILAQEFKLFQLRFHVDPYADTGLAFKYTDKEKWFLSQITGSDRQNFVEEDKENKPVLCNAGQVHISVQPNGDAYRCINAKINEDKEGIIEHKKLGNILDKDFKLLKAKARCDIANICAGCDRDKVDMEFLKQGVTVNG